ncbi:hypothetical protein OEB99_16605 [Actinotalea sp. M2MS4P-6]|uniref:hypothetical protein n=1 Tax=Actinotalea sp. M2MS4P-6 TaxID=2983762 RepID=UPI0021E4681F|nr:hypothetical protein [Actinotalea sp. M2MS4P-6]MCV2395938.1 hypothetical protein [Actinotalea sp. M2MS4P-6]
MEFSRWIAHPSMLANSQAEGLRVEHGSRVGVRRPERAPMWVGTCMMTVSGARTRTADGSEGNSMKNVTVVLSYFSTSRQPADTVAFEGVMNLQVADNGALIVIGQNSRVIAAFPQGQWAAVYADESMKGYSNP